MGMSSSQARLLTLTARQHDVELRAQKLQADKLRMANDSDRVYNTYLDALSATKIQARVYDKWEPDTFKDASLAMLEHGLLDTHTGDVAANPLFLQEIGQDGSGRILITEAIANKYHLPKDPTLGPYPGSIDQFFTERNCTKIKTGATRVIGTTSGGTNATVVAFYPTANTMGTGFSRSLNVSGVVSNAPVEFKDDTRYDEFQLSVTSIPPTDTQITADTSSLTAGRYYIDDAAGLMRLSELSRESGGIPEDVTIYLTGNIDMSPISNWEGIKDFQGTFDGNGYEIRNLTGTEGLFVNVKGANTVVKNLGLVDVSITSDRKSTDYKNPDGTVDSGRQLKEYGTGGISGALSDGATIENCYLTGEIKGEGWLGGVVGMNNSGTIKNCNADINITASDGCIGGISGHNSGTIEGCNATGEIIASGSFGVGGLVGHNDGTTVITNSKTTVESNKGGIVLGTDGNYKTGTIKVNGKDKTTYFYKKKDGTEFEDKAFEVQSNTDGFGHATYTYRGEEVTGVMNYDGSLKIKDVEYKQIEGMQVVNETSRTYNADAFKTEINIPHKDDFEQNILAALVKKEGIDINNDALLDTYKTKISKYANNLYAGGQEDRLKIANINDRIFDYITDGNTYNTSEDNSFMAALYSDIMAGGIPNKTVESTYQQKYNVSNTQVSGISEKTGYNCLNETPGVLNIPTKDIIRQNLELALKKSGVTDPKDINQVNDFIKKYDISKEEDKLSLAYINEVVVAYSNGQRQDEFNKIRDDILSRTSKTSGTPKTHPAGQYNVDLNITNAPRADYGNDVIEVTEDIEDWDWSSKEVQDALQEYMLRKNGYKVIENDIANSTNWLTNYVNAGLAQFVSCDIDSAIVDNANGTKMVDVERMGVRGTSVASETSLQEVPDTEFVKRAEADYEAAMRKINRKETKIDTELSELEAERTSIKTEQDGLKKVIDDNVNLTFKLFS